MEVDKPNESFNGRDDVSFLLLLYGFHRNVCEILKISKNLLDHSRKLLEMSGMPLNNLGIPQKCLEIS